MAYETGTASDYRDLLYKVILFLTSDSTLVGLGQNWSLNTGRISNQVTQYIDNTLFKTVGLVNYDKAFALGSEETLDASAGWKGWLLPVGQLTTGYLGVQFSSATLPLTYTIRGAGWTTISGAAMCPASWNLQYSDDGIAWTTSDTETGETTWTDFEERSYNVNQTAGTHAYWRVLFNTNNGDGAYLQITQLRFYDSGSNWISYQYSPEYMLEAPGLTTTESIYSGIRLYQDEVSDYYNWGVAAMTGHLPTERFNNQPGLTSDSYMCLWDDPMTYWLVASGQRAMLLVKVSGVAEFMYLGKFLPYGTPAQYPYPVIKSAPHTLATGRWSDATGTHRSLQHPTDSSSVYLPTNQWVNIRNTATTGTSIESAWTSVCGLFPTTYLSAGGVSAAIDSVQSNDDGGYTLLPYRIFKLGADKAVFGEIDGLYWVTGDGNTFENIITIDSQDYIVFNNVFRTGRNDYAAMRLL